MPGEWHQGVTAATQFWQQAINSYHHLNPVLRVAVQPVVFLVKFLPPIYLMERLSGGRTSQYRASGFRQDLVYLVVHMAGFFRTLTTVYVIGLVAPYLKVFDLHLIARIPERWLVGRSLAYLLAADMMMYWYHRWQHSNRFLWAFHTTHHSQKDLSFVTQTRFHPVEDLLLQLGTYVPLLILGATARDWARTLVLFRFIEYLQHSEVRWNFGPLSRIFVTPRFHAFHHSAQPEHYNRNYAVVFSFWDRLFGTFVDAPQRPARYGIEGIEMPTVASTFLLPFRLAYEFCWKRAPLAAASAAED